MKELAEATAVRLHAVLAEHGLPRVIPGVGRRPAPAPCFCLFGFVDCFCFSCASSFGAGRRWRRSAQRSARSAPCRRSAPALRPGAQPRRSAPALRLRPLLLGYESRDACPSDNSWTPSSAARTSYTEYSRLGCLFSTTALPVESDLSSPTPGLWLSG